MAKSMMSFKGGKGTKGVKKQMPKKTWKKMTEEEVQRARDWYVKDCGFPPWPIWMTEAIVAHGYGVSFEGPATLPPALAFGAGASGLFRFILGWGPAGVPRVFPT